MGHPTSRNGWIGLFIFSVLGGCARVAEIQETRTRNMEQVSEIATEIVSEPLQVPESISADVAGAATYDALVRASNLLLLLQDVFEQSEDMAIPFHTLRILPDSMRNIAKDNVDEDAKAAIARFAASIEDNRADLDSLALNSAVSMSTPDQNGVSFAVGMAVDAYFTKESISARYREAISAAATVEANLEAKYGVDFPTLTIVGFDESAEMSDDEFAADAAVQFWQEAGKYAPPEE